jgi:hypothetical protein
VVLLINFKKYSIKADNTHRAERRRGRDQSREILPLSQYMRDEYPHNQGRKYAAYHNYIYVYIYIYTIPYI